MDKVEIPKARALTWDERAALIDAELDPQFWPVEKRVDGKWERDLIAHVMKNIFPDFVYAAVPYPKVAGLATKCYRMTVAVDKDLVDEEKNS